MRIRTRFPGALLLCASNAFAAGPQTEPADRQIAAIVDPIVENEIAAGVPGAAFVFVRNGDVVYQRGYGVADLATKAKVDPERTVWPIASITKAVTAMAALQLVADGRVKLDDDLNRHLKRLQVPAQGYSPLTLRHMLSHTGALDEIPGRRHDGKQAPDMAAFLRDKLVRYREPGKLTAYSTYGMALAGVLIEDVSGQSYADYLKQHIFTPAGMSSARVMLRQGDAKGVATPYEIDDGRATAIPYEWYMTPPTSSMVATAADMGRLLLVQLANGRAGNIQILSPALTRAMHEQQATNHPDLPGWSLGFQLDNVNDVAVVEHGGDIAGFSALFALMPEKHEGFFIVNHGESSDLRFRVKQALLDALHPAKPASVPAADPKNAPALAEYAGRYISSITCRTCPLSDEQVFVVKAQPNGTLSLWGQTWVPVRRDLFVRDDGKRLLGFARDEKSKIVSVTGGSWRVADRLP
jgi:CubicO group peptidase (beta-lactamase class C family)